MGEIVPVLRGYIQGLRTRSPRGIVTPGLAVLAAGLTGIFRCVERQQDLDARMPEFIGLILLAGNLHAIGVFLVERYSLCNAPPLPLLVSGGLLCAPDGPTPPPTSERSVSPTMRSPS